MPKVPDSHLEERREEIVRAALRCYERGGYHGTSVRDVCDEAGLSVGAVYRYFDGKEEIFGAARELGGVETRLLDSLSGAEDLGDASLRFLRSALAALASESGRRSARVDLRLRADALDVGRLREATEDQYAEWREALAPRLEAAAAGQTGGTGASGTRARGVAELLVAVLVGAQTAVALDAGTDVEALLRGAEALLEGPPAETEGRPGHRPEP